LTLNMMLFIVASSEGGSWTPGQHDKPRSFPVNRPDRYANAFPL
jgi:hypothetical protein